MTELDLPNSILNLNVMVSFQEREEEHFQTQSVRSALQLNYNLTKTLNQDIKLTGKILFNTYIWL